VLPFVLLLFAILMVCLVPFAASVVLARRDASRGLYRLTNRVCMVAAFLTVAYSLAICLFRSPFEIRSPDELVNWLVVIGVWDLTLMGFSTIFAALGYSWATHSKASLKSSVSVPQSVIVPIPSAGHETGNPYQVPRD